MTIYTFNIFKDVHMYIYIYAHGTQMTPVLIGKDLVLEGSNPKIEDKQVPGIDIYIYRFNMFNDVYMYICARNRNDPGSKIQGLCLETLKHRDFCRS